MASPNGRTALSPPRNVFQIVSANVCASESDEKPTAPVAPPKERVTILPAFWHVLMSSPMSSHLASAVPLKTELPEELQVCCCVRTEKGHTRQ